MRKTGSVLALLVLVLSLISGCSCLAAQAYDQPACEKYHTDWPFDPGEDD
jgi:hypothetical protein